MSLGEFNQRTVVGLTVQEFIPSLDTEYPWESGELNVSGDHTVMTHSSVKIVTLLMITNLPPSVTSTGTHTGQIGAGDISTINDFLWMSEGLDTPALLAD